jgi:hypothetical protein
MNKNRRLRPTVSAPANQLRLSSAGSEDGEAETKNLSSGEATVANDDSNLRPSRAQLTEPPDAGPHVLVGWEGDGQALYPYPDSEPSLVEPGWNHIPLCDVADAGNVAVAGDNETFLSNWRSSGEKLR